MPPRGLARIRESFGGAAPEGREVSVRSRGRGSNRLLMQAQKEAAARYQQLQAQIAETQARVRQQLAGLGESGLKRIGESEKERLSQTQQSLISRGLGNTTVVESARRGVMEDTERMRQELQERIAQLGLGTEMQLGQLGLQGFEMAPDLMQFIEMMNALGGGS